MLSVILYNAHRAWLVGMGKRKHQDEDSDNEEGTVVKKEKAEHIVVDEETPRKHKKHKHQAADEEPSKKKVKVESESEGVTIQVEDEATVTDTPSYAELALRVIPIAKPLASEKLASRLYKTVRKAAKKKTLRRGVKEVTKSLRKGEKGFTILAGDISPLDVISHIPVYCEEQKVPYVFIPSRYDLGSAALTKRPTSMVLIKQNQEYEKHYKKCLAEITALPHPLL